jgi:hypothetical protein
MIKETDFVDTKICELFSIYVKEKKYDIPHKYLDQFKLSENFIDELTNIIKKNFD